MTTRVGLALGGGGARGAFTVGVLRYLVQAKRIRTFPVISGTSTGALIASLLGLGKMARLHKLYTNVKTADIVNPHHSLVANALGTEAAILASIVFGGEAVFDASALDRIIEAHVDFDELIARKDRTLVIFNTVDLKSGEIRSYDNRTHAASTLRKALFASASIPVFMDPVDLGGGGTSFQLVDGGVRELVPMAAAFQSGVGLDVLISIATEPTSPRAMKRRTSVIEILTRTMDLLLVETGSNDVRLAQATNLALRLIENAINAGVTEDQIFQGVPEDERGIVSGKRPVRLVHVAPAEHLDIDALSFNPEAMQAAMDQGFNRAIEVLEPFFEG